MNKLSSTSKLAISVVVAVVAIILIVWYGWGGSHNAASGTPSQTTSTVAAGTMTPGENMPTSTGTTAPKGNGGTSVGNPAPAPQLTYIALVTPVPGVSWTIAMPNLIGWAKEAGVTGQIDLDDAATGDQVGVILAQTGPHQTSYSWNTRDIYLSRTNPSKTTVVPGRYIIKIFFDGNNIAPIVSQPFTLTQ